MQVGLRIASPYKPPKTGSNGSASAVRDTCGIGSPERSTSVVGHEGHRRGPHPVNRDGCRGRRAMRALSAPAARLTQKQRLGRAGELCRWSVERHEDDPGSQADWKRLIALDEGWIRPSGGHCRRLLSGGHGGAGPILGSCGHRPHGWLRLFGFLPVARWAGPRAKRPAAAYSMRRQASPPLRIRARSLIHSDIPLPVRRGDAETGCMDPASGSAPWAPQVPSRAIGVTAETGRIRGHRVTRRPAWRDRACRVPMCEATSDPGPPGQSSNNRITGTPRPWAMALMLSRETFRFPASISDR